MNKKRKILLLDAVDALNNASDVIMDVQSEEEDSFDALPDSLRDGPCGVKMQQAINQMDNFLENINNISKQICQYVNE